jgi:hypothetical protein
LRIGFITARIAITPPIMAHAVSPMDVVHNAHPATVVDVPNARKISKALLKR